MGSIVIASCQCGVETKIIVGGLRSNYLTYSPFPGLCEHCSAIVEINTLDEEMRCPKCKSAKITLYDDPSLSVPPKIKLPEKAWYLFWRKKPEVPEECEVASMLNLREKNGTHFKLMERDYKCSQCDQMTLRFVLHAFAD